jgi:voltage-gated potassium channel
MVIEGWGLLDSLYMTVITLTTVGYGEVHKSSQAGRIFSVILMFMGVGFFLYAIGAIVQFLVEGRMRLILGRRKLDKQINKLKAHYIVCGYGRIGRVLSKFLSQKNLNVLVIERNQDLVHVLDEDNNLYITGGATDEANLVKAGIERASGLVAALGTDADNVFLVLMAKQRNPDLFVVARASQDETKKTLYAAGANVVVSPYDIGARRMAHAILRPTVIDFLELAFADESTDVYIEEITMKATSSLVDKSLQDLVREDLNLNVMAMKKRDGVMLFNPLVETRIEAGDTVIVLGESENLRKLVKLMNP